MSPGPRVFAAMLGADVRELQRLLRVWAEVESSGQPAEARKAAAAASDLIDAMRAKLHAAQLQLVDELREHDARVAARVADLAARPDATRARPARARTAGGGGQ